MTNPVIGSNGNKHWFNNQRQLHREDGPAIEYADGDKRWFLNGQRHREDGPAVEWANGSKSWWINGKRHREDGPAVEYADGYKEWWLNGKKVEEKDVIKPMVEFGKSPTSGLLKMVMSKQCLH